MAKETTLIAHLQVEKEKMSGDAPKANLLLGLVSQSDHIPVVNPRVKPKIVSHTLAACHLQ